MLENELNTIITHVLSQILYKWINVPFEKNRDGEEYDEIFLMPENEWEDFIKKQLGKNLNQVPWCMVFSKQDKINIADLAGVIVRHLNEIKKSGSKYLLISDGRYPELLREIKNPPLAISIHGDLNILGNLKIAVVGSRKASGFSRFETEKLAAALSLSGVTIVSGGAYGCDISAHYGAVISGIIPVPTIVVFAGGLGQPYPRGNMDVFRDIAKRGGIFLSERLFWQQSLPRDFPVRNRIISGLCSKVLIMQASGRSGAMVTANIALDQGRDVIVLKHSTGDIRGEGNEILIDDGADHFKTSEEFMSRFFS
ncbi:MAG: DNA-protecting protein DprA [Oligoflexales bacterium]|nr:DNA-protecting protein DprA [Oligoflexales bacterium]